MSISTMSPPQHLALLFPLVNSRYTGMTVFRFNSPSKTFDGQVTLDCSGQLTGMSPMLRTRRGHCNYYARRSGGEVL